MNQRKIFTNEMQYLFRRMVFIVRTYITRKGETKNKIQRMNHTEL